MRRIHDMHVFVPMASSGLSLTWGAKCSICRHQGECYLMPCDCFEYKDNKDVKTISAKIPIMNKLS